jgi:hypothetical protein
MIGTIILIVWVVGFITIYTLDIFFNLSRFFPCREEMLVFATIWIAFAIMAVVIGPFYLFDKYVAQPLKKRFNQSL